MITSLVLVSRINTRFFEVSFAADELGIQISPKIAIYLMPGLVCCKLTENNVHSFAFSFA